MEKQSFFKELKDFISWLREPVEGVQAYSAIVVFFIAIGCTVVDTFIPFVLVIAAFIFIRKGHKALGCLLVAMNLFPDDLPLVDEAIGIVINIVPLWNKYKKIIKGMVKASDTVDKITTNK